MGGIDVTAGGTVNGVSGVLTVTHTDGMYSYSYTLSDNTTDAAGVESDTFSVKVTDSDGDTATTSLVITIVDDVPTAHNDSGTQSAEDAAVTVNVINNDVPGADSVSLTTGVALVAGSNTGTGTPVYNNDGTFTYTPGAGEARHGYVPVPDHRRRWRYVGCDSDHHAARGLVPSPSNAVASVDDDGLSGGNAAGTGDINATTGSNPASGSELVFNGSISVNFGNDTGTVDFSNLNGTFVTVGTERIALSWNAGTHILTGTVAHFAADLTTVQARDGTPLFNVNLAPGGAYTVTLLDNVLHAAGGNETSTTVDLFYHAADSDGDSSNAGKLTVTFNDDTPTLGTVQSQQTDNNINTAPAVGTLHFSAGADGAGSNSTMTITADNTGITSGGHNLVTHQVDNVLTAYQDVGPAGYDAGDTTAVYTITVDTSGVGHYTFDLLAPLDTSTTPIDIGQGSSFGAGPSESIIVHDTASNQDLVFVTAWSGAGVGGFTPAEQTSWLAGNEPDWAQESDVNGSTQGWGRGNNNFDAGEILRFDFGTLDDYDNQQAPDGPYVPPAASIVNVSFATFTFFNFNDAADQLEFVAHYTNGLTQSFVLHGADNPTSLTITAPSGFNIAWIDAFEQGGSIKLNLATVGVNSTTIDETINATVQLTDGDGDTTSTGAFSIHVATGLTPAAPVAPVVLDLNGDGVHFRRSLPGSATITVTGRLRLPGRTRMTVSWCTTRTTTGRSTMPPSSYSDPAASRTSRRSRRTTPTTTDSCLRPMPTSAASRCGRTPTATVWSMRAR